MIRRLVVFPFLKSITWALPLWGVGYVIAETTGLSSVEALRVGFLIFCLSVLASMLIYSSNDSAEVEAYNVEEEAVRKEVEEDWLKIENKSGKTTHFGRVPVDEFQLRRIADALLAGSTFSEREWGRVLTPRIHILTRRGLIKANILEWKSEVNRRSGLRLTQSGRVWCKELVGSDPPPPLGETIKILYHDARTRTKEGRNG